MGTASIIVGIGLMLVGFATIGQSLLSTFWTVEQFFDMLIFNIIIGLPFIIIGTILLRKYDRLLRK